MKEKKSHIGSECNMWEILNKCGSRVYNAKNKQKIVPFVLAKCRCGTIREVNYNNIISGVSKSCGCVSKAKTTARSTKHGYATRKNWTKEHRIWCGLFRRCYDKKDLAYNRYGGVGIIVCERWHDFKNFIEDMGRIPADKSSIDRYPNKKGNYEPGNCRWADNFEQSRNRSNNVNVTISGVTMTAREAERLLGLPKDRIQSRIKAGYTVDEAINLPPYAKNKKEYIKCRIK